MPFGHWKDFDACLADIKKKNPSYSDDVAKKVCGKLKTKLEKGEKIEDHDLTAEDEKSYEKEYTSSKPSPSIKDMKEITPIPVTKAWEFDPNNILNSSRKVRGTFHVPKIDKDKEIITKAAMANAIPDYMHLPILHDFHKERVLGLVTKVWEESDAFHFEALFKATSDVNDAWEKAKKGEYDHVSIYGARLSGNASCVLNPDQRSTPCISDKIRLDSISACDEKARNDATTMEVIKASESFLIDGADIYIKAATTDNSALIHGTWDGVKNIKDAEDAWEKDEVEKGDYYDNTHGRGNLRRGDSSNPEPLTGRGSGSIGFRPTRTLGSKRFTQRTNETRTKAPSLEKGLPEDIGRHFQAHPEDREKWQAKEPKKEEKKAYEDDELEVGTLCSSCASAYGRKRETNKEARERRQKSSNYGKAEEDMEKCGKCGQEIVKKGDKVDNWISTTKEQGWDPDTVSDYIVDEKQRKEVKDRLRKTRVREVSEDDEDEERDKKVEKGKDDWQKDAFDKLEREDPKRAAEYRRHQEKEDKMEKADEGVEKGAMGEAIQYHTERDRETARAGQREPYMSGTYARKELYSRQPPPTAKAEEPESVQRIPPDKDSKKVKSTETKQAPEGYKRVEKADDGEEPEVEKGQSVEGMFREIRDWLKKLVSSDKKVHSEMGKASGEGEEDVEEKKAMGKKRDYSMEHNSSSDRGYYSRQGARPNTVLSTGSRSHGGGVVTPGERASAQREHLKKGEEDVRENFSRTNRFTERKADDVEKSKTETGGSRTQAVKLGNRKRFDLTERSVKVGMRERGESQPELKPVKKGDTMEVVENKIEKSEVDKSDEEFVTEIVKANLPKTEDIVKAALEKQQSEIMKALDERFKTLEEKIKKVEDQPIAKAVVVIPEQAGEPITGNYSAIEKFSKRG